MEACGDFQGNVLSVTNKADADLLEARKALMKVLHKTLVSVEKRMETMVKMIPVVEERAEQISTDTTELVALFVDKSAKARKTVEVSKQKAAEMQNGIDQQLERREESRAQHETDMKAIGDRNNELEEQLKAIMNELHKNEQEMRKKDAEDRAVEKKHQENVARDQQQLATLVGCADEMERFVVMLDESKVAAEQTAAVANLLLVDHERSVKKNIEKDIALTEATGRQYDTMHFNMFCAAWSNTFERELYTKKGRLDTQQKIEESRAEVKMAKKTK